MPKPKVATKSVRRSASLPRKSAAPVRKSTAKIKLPPSAMAVAFRHLKPTWRSYVDLVEAAAREGDKEMAKVYRTWVDLPPREKQTISPEMLCDLCSVKPSVLIGAVTAQLWAQNSQEASMITAIYHPRVIERTAKQALNGKNGFGDRELFHKATGFLPTPKGGGITIDASQKTLVAGGNSKVPASLPSMETEMMNLEASKALPASRVHSTQETSLNHADVSTVLEGDPL